MNPIDFNHQGMIQKTIIVNKSKAIPIQFSRLFIEKIIYIVFFLFGDQWTNA